MDSRLRGNDGGLDYRLRGNGGGLDCRPRGNGETIAACCVSGAQIKHQHFGVLALGQCQRRLGLQQSGIAGL